MDMFAKLIENLKTTRRTIVFTEGPDPRILEAAARLKKDDLMDVILVGNVDEVKAAAAAGNFDIEGQTILDPATYEGMDEMVATMVELRSEEFTPALMDRVTRSAGAAASLVPVIVEFVTDTLRHQGSANVAVAGQMRLLDQPEYRDVDKAQRVLTTLDDETLANLPAIMQGANGTQVLVGPENVAAELKDTSVVVTKFDIGDGMQGMIGVVGPTRMDYAKVTARLSYFAESLSKAFSKPEQPEPKQLPQPPEPET